MIWDWWGYVVMKYYGWNKIRIKIEGVIGDVLG